MKNSNPSIANKKVFQQKQPRSLHSCFTLPGFFTSIRHSIIDFIALFWGPSP